MVSGCVFMKVWWRHLKHFFGALWPPSERPMRPRAGLNTVWLLGCPTKAPMAATEHRNTWNKYLREPTRASVWHPRLISYTHSQRKPRHEVRKFNSVSCLRCLSSTFRKNAFCMFLRLTALSSLLIREKLLGNTVLPNLLFNSVGGPPFTGVP